MSEEPLPHVEVAGFALGKLEPAEERAFRAHLLTCADCRRELAELTAVPDLLRLAAPAEPVPADLRARTLRLVRETAAREAAPVPAAPPLRRRWTVPVAAASVAVAAAVAAVVVLGPSGGARSELTLVADDGSGASGRVVVTETDAGRSFDVAIEGLAPPPQGSLYELWAVGPGDSLERPNRVSLATFTSTEPSGAVRFQSFSAAPAARFPVVGVTLEPDDGDPARTGPRVLAPGPPPGGS